MKIRTAIIGLGPHGKRFAQCVLNNKNTTLVAVVDRDPAKFEGFDFPDSAKKITDLSALWRENVEMILIATNGPSHAPIALEAMEKGVKYILVTKPVASTLAEARAMELAAKKHNVRVAVDHGLRFDNTYGWLRTKVKDRSLGELKTIYIQRPGIGLGCLGVHSFDLATALAHADVESVTGWVDKPIGRNPRGEQFVDPGGLVIVNYKNGVKAIISQIEDGSGPMSVELNFTSARARVDEKFKTLEVIAKGPSDPSNPKAPRAFEKIENPHGENVSHDTVRLMSAVIDDLVSGNALEADLKWGILSFEILLAAYESHDGGNVPVKLPITSPKAEKRFLSVT